MSSAPSQATLTIKSGPEAGRVVDLSEGELLIGRIEPAGLVLNDFGSVSATCPFELPRGGVLFGGPGQR